MVRLYIFGIKNCGKCLTVKGRVDNLRRRGELTHVEIVYHDQGHFEGRAEGAWYDVDDTLPVLVIEEGERRIARWEGRAPKSEEIRLCLETAGVPAAG